MAVLLVLSIIALIVVYINMEQKYNSMVYNYNVEIQNLNTELNNWQEKIATLDDCEKKIEELEDKKTQLSLEIKDLESEYLCHLVDISEYEGMTSEECKNKLSLLKLELNDLIKNDKAVIIGDYSISKNRITANKKQILLCFNTECTNVINNLSVKNADTSRSKIERVFNNTNKIFFVDGIQLAPSLLEKKLQELSLVYAALLKKEQEKEEQKAIREQMIEEEKVRREIERQKAKIVKEETQFKNEISKLMSYMQKASDIEKQLYIDKIKELEEKLKQLEKDMENVLDREQNTRAGFVYVISNIGSFGENIYKIGMTRRLEPMDRVKELGDASVPFEFDVHAMIFSEDAPALETTLHNTFRGKEVNKVNLRKEFFKVSLDEIEKVVKENHNATIQFTKIAEAAQYRETLKMEQVTNKS